MKKSRLLKKGKNENQHVISCLSGNPAECKSLLNIIPLDSRVKPENDKEVGRSMVEMLGVLAVMGVLSIAGIAGYNNAMNRHRANELLYEASKRATVVAAQAMMGRTGTISLGEFGNNSVSGATFGASATIENNQIKLTLSGVADPVCAQIKTALGDNAIMAVDNKCTILAFNADMTKGVTKPASCDPACTGGKKCVAENTCGCPDDKPFWNGSACVAKATCTESQWYNAKTNQCDAKAECGKSYWEDVNEYDDYYAPEINGCMYKTDCKDFGFITNENDKTCVCPTGTTPYISAGYYLGCCPNENQPVMGQCVSGTCSGTWYCDGELDNDGICIDSVECCNGVIIHDSAGDNGGWQYCCPSESPVYDLDAGCTPCTGGQQRFDDHAGYPICQCAEGFYFDYDNAKDCVADE